MIKIVRQTFRQLPSTFNLTYGEIKLHTNNKKSASILEKMFIYITNSVAFQKKLLHDKSSLEHLPLPTEDDGYARTCAVN